MLKRNIYTSLTDELGIMRLYYVTGTFVAFLKSCNRDPNKMILSLFQHFGTYRDEVNYKGDLVRFFTKARMLLQNIWIYFNKHEFGLEFQKQNMMPTMLMDYRAFQVLYHLKALRYSEKLLSRFEKEDELTHGSAEEVEIRSCSMYIIEEVCAHVIQMCERRKTQIPELDTKDFNIAILIDNFLWDYRQKYDQELKENVPYPNISSEQY